MVSLQEVTASLTLNVKLRKVPIHVFTEDGTLILSGVVTAESFEKAVSARCPQQHERHPRFGLRGQLRRDTGNPPGVAGRGDDARRKVQLGEGCTLRLEARSTLEKPISINGNGALGTTGVLVIADGVTLNERVDVQANAASTISVLSGATLYLPDGATLTSIHR